jgi:hypothetical protein
VLLLSLSSLLWSLVCLRCVVVAVVVVGVLVVVVVAVVVVVVVAVVVVAVVGLAAFLFGCLMKRWGVQLHITSESSFNQATVHDYIKRCGTGEGGCIHSHITLVKAVAHVAAETQNYTWWFKCGDASWSPPLAPCPLREC